MNMAAKSKSGLSETPAKVSPATPRVSSKLSRGLVKPEHSSPSPLRAARHSSDRSSRSSLSSKPAVDRKMPKPEPGSPSPLQGTRNLADRSPRLSLNSKPSVDQRSPSHLADRSPRSSLNSKPAIDQRSPKVATPSEKPQTRASELQAQLNWAQEDLKKAKEQISLIEKEKALAMDELKETQKSAEEANEKLREALVAQRQAAESSEIEKFRAVELEQAGIEAVQKKDEEWQKEIESMRNQHALDATALRSTTEELERVKQELAVACDEKNQALNHADEATRVADIHAKKVEVLSAELVQLKSLIDLEREKEVNENKEIVSKCKEEIESLKQLVEKSRMYEEKLIEGEAFIEQLNVDLEAARMAESYAYNVVEEWKNRVKELEMQLGEAKKLERCASESMVSVMKQLESNNKSLLDAQSEIAALKENGGLMEMKITKQRLELEESEHCINKAREETTEMTTLIESLKSELETMKEENTRALNNEKLAASSVQILEQEKAELVKELESSRDEIEKSKKALESLAAAIYQVSAEAKEAKEKLLSSQKEQENYETKLEDLRTFLKATDEKHETMLGDAKNEIALLTITIEQSKNEYQTSRTEWERKEQHFLDSIKRSEEKNFSQEKEISRLVNLLKQFEEEASASKEEEVQLKESLKEVESEVIYLQEAFREVETENRTLKTSLLDKETELQKVVRENVELQAREDASLKKAEELSKLLEEATIRKKREENDEPTNIGKDYDLLPKVFEFSEENRHGSEQKPQLELPSEQPEDPKKGNSKDEALQEDGAKGENTNGRQVKEIETKRNEDDSEKVEFKMWEPDLKSFVQEVESKVEVSEGFTDQINGSTKNVDDGGNSSPKQQQEQKQKKKYALIRKFGSLLKKKKKGSNKQQ